MKRSWFVSTFIVILLTIFSVAAFAQEIRLGGGAPPIERVITPVKEHFTGATGIKINAISYGPKFAIMDLDKGAIDAAVLFLTPEEVAGIIKKENLEVKNLSSFIGSKVSEDRIVIIVNNNNPVNRLSKEQAKGILTGKIDNWKDVGGNDMPIIVVFGTLIKGVNELVSKKIMDGENYVTDMLVVDTASDVLNAVSTTQEAIGLASEGLMNGSVKPLEEPMVSVPVIIYTKGQPSPDVQRLIDFIKGEGQKYIKNR